MKNKTFHKRKILVVFAGAFAMIFVFDRKTDLSYGI